MAESATLHVVPSGEVWAVKMQGERQARRLAPSRDEAYAHAEALARTLGTTRVVLHREDGAIDAQVVVVPPPPDVVPPRTVSPALAGALLGAALAGVLAVWWTLRDD